MDNYTSVDPETGNTKPNILESVTNNDIPTMSLDRTLPRQVSTGNQRGIQNITGAQTINDPISNNPVITISGVTQTVTIADPITKINHVILGLLPSGNYGLSVSSLPGTTALPTGATATTGTISFGTLTDGGVGMQTVDSSNFLLFKLEGATWYWYDKATGKNVIQIGLLPDGTYGMAIAKTGFNVSDGVF